MAQRVFILMREDPFSQNEATPVAVYSLDEREAAKHDRDHRQKVNPRSRYYLIDKPLNPKSGKFDQEELRHGE